MKLHKTKRAFTMVELVFVIVILGIVASIGSTIMAQLFENYIIQRAMHKVSLKTELAANQIANRLTYRINGSLVTTGATFGTRILSGVAANSSDALPERLEWIGYDNDSFSGAALPGWSGYCDTTATNAGGAGVAKINIITPGSNLAYTNTIIGNLSGGIKTIADSAVLFSTNVYNAANLIQDGNCFGFTGPTTCIHHIGNFNDTTLVKDANFVVGDNLMNHYKLAWTAYAIEPTNVRTNNLFDLQLRYNYQPWDGQTFLNGQTSLLIRNVTSFKYNETGGTVRFKLCATEDIGTDVNISVCKEKVVIR